MFHRNHQRRRKKREVEDDYDEQSDFSHYNTPSPINKTISEEMRRIFEERECKDYCFAGGTCIVHIDPKTHNYIGKECRCPKNYYGSQCNEYFVRDLYKNDPAAAKGLQAQSNAVPGLTFVLILLIFACLLARHSYKRFLKKQKKEFNQWRTTFYDSALQPSPFSPYGTHSSKNSRYVSNIGWSPIIVKTDHISFPETTIGIQGQNISKSMQNGTKYITALPDV